MARRRDKPMPMPTLPSNHYFVRSRQPLASLIFLLPLLIAYEIGAYWYVTPHTGRELAARTLLRGFFEYFGAFGEYLPGLAVVIVLLCWHMAKRDPWRLEPRLYLGMAFESAALAVPALMFSMLIGRQTAWAALGPDPSEYAAQLFMSIGAGIYEELVFRLILIAVIHTIVVDVVGMTEGWGASVAIAGSAVLFAACHFMTGTVGFTWPLMVYYAMLGLYLAVLFVLRGFGVVAATHAIFDIVIVSINHGVLPNP